MRVIDRSASYDAVLATWRSRPDLYRVTGSDAFELDCGCDDVESDAESSDAEDCHCPEKAAPPSATGRLRSSPSRNSSTPLKPGPFGGATNELQTDELQAGGFQTGGFQTGGFQTGGFQAGGFQAGGIQANSFDSAYADSVDPRACIPNVDGPPEANKFEDWEAWEEHWGDCFPEGPIGPGVAEGADLVAAYNESLTYCRYEAAIDSLHRGADTVPPDYNWVVYSWIGPGPDFVVEDALCGIASDLNVNLALGWLIFESTTGGGDDLNIPAPEVDTNNEGEEGSTIDTGLNSPLDDVPDEVILTVSQIASAEAEAQQLEEAAVFCEVNPDRCNPEWWVEEASDEERRERRSFCDSIYSGNDPSLAANSPDCLAFFEGCGYPEDLIGAEEDGCGTATGWGPSTQGGDEPFMDPLGGDDPCSSPFIRC